MQRCNAALFADTGWQGDHGGRWANCPVPLFHPSCAAPRGADNALSDPPPAPLRPAVAAMP
eukprot:14651842-Alexandrium_andersonii.AAC.1